MDALFGVLHRGGRLITLSAPRARQSRRIRCHGEFSLSRPTETAHRTRRAKSTVAGCGWNSRRRFRSRMREAFESGGVPTGARARLSLSFGLTGRHISRVLVLRRCRRECGVHLGHADNVRSSLREPPRLSGGVLTSCPGGSTVVIGLPGLWGCVPCGVVGQLRHQACWGGPVPGCTRCHIGSRRAAVMGVARRYVTRMVLPGSMRV